MCQMIVVQGGKVYAAVIQKLAVCICVCVLTGVKMFVSSFKRVVKKND